VLIANRGEIALRINRACHELGVATVAIFSEPDRNSLHVRHADEAFCVGPGPVARSYLSIPNIISTALITGCDAVHPGYGFLAENAGFARAVEGAGLIWIGPPASVVALMGDKIVAKELARSAGVPVVPGYFGDDQSAERMLAEAESIGLPVMVKAAAGGGGRGMREVHAIDDFLDALESARREAVSTSNSDLMFVERLLRAPRHIEVQILADHHGGVVALGERDCSVQRRHQKVLEEAPSPVLNADLRRSMSQDAVRLAQASGYTNAGTIEFLVTPDGRFYFTAHQRAGQHQRANPVRRAGND